MTIPLRTVVTWIGRTDQYQIIFFAKATGNAEGTFDTEPGFIHWTLPQVTYTLGTMREIRMNDISSPHNHNDFHIRKLGGRMTTIIVKEREMIIMPINGRGEPSTYCEYIVLGEQRHATIYLMDDWRR